MQHKINTYHPMKQIVPKDSDNMSNQEAHDHFSS